MRKTALILALLAVLAAQPAQALLVNLTDEQIEQAIAQGKTTFEQYKKAGRPIDDLDPEYIVDLGDDVGRALVFTEFGTLVMETRRFLAISRPLPRPEVNRVLGATSGRIEFLVVALSANRDYLKNATVTVVQGETHLRPLEWSIARSAPKPDAPGRFLTSGRYIFDARALGSVPTVLLVQGSDGQELRYEFDLSRLR